VGLMQRERRRFWGQHEIQKGHRPWVLCLVRSSRIYDCAIALLLWEI
jgi:hypothetical protein